MRRLPLAGMPSEERLEDLIEADPGVLGQPLLIVGRQVVTAHGKRIDLLGLDGDGALHILELKRDKTPRDVIAQVLDSFTEHRNRHVIDVIPLGTPIAIRKRIVIS